MNVGDRCQRNIVSISAFDDLTSAAQAMRDRHVGYLIVVEPSIQDVCFHPIGVITDRDIVVAVVAPESDARGLRVGDVMTRGPVVSQEAESLGTSSMPSSNRLTRTNARVVA